MLEGKGVFADREIKFQAEIADFRQSDRFPVDRQRKIGVSHPLEGDLGFQSGKGLLIGRGDGQLLGDVFLIDLAPHGLEQEGGAGGAFFQRRQGGVGAALPLGSALAGKVLPGELIRALPAGVAGTDPVGGVGDVKRKLALLGHLVPPVQHRVEVCGGEVGGAVILHQHKIKQPVVQPVEGIGVAVGEFLIEAPGAGATFIHRGMGPDRAGQQPHIIVPVHRPHSLDRGGDRLLDAVGHELVEIELRRLLLMGLLAAGALVGIAVILDQIAVEGVSGGRLRGGVFDFFPVHLQGGIPAVLLPHVAVQDAVDENALLPGAFQDVGQRVEVLAVFLLQREAFINAGRIERLTILQQRQQQGVEFPFLQRCEGGVDLLPDLSGGFLAADQVVDAGGEPDTPHLLRTGVISAALDQGGRRLRFTG